MAEISSYQNSVITQNTLKKLTEFEWSDQGYGRRPRYQATKVE